jgi:hypothetical protein
MDRAPAFQAEERPDLTDLPAFNEFQGRVERVLAQTLPVEAGLESLTALEDALGQIFHHFHENLPYQEETEAVKQATPLIYQGFGKLRLVLPELRQALDGGSEGKVRRMLARARHLVNQIFNGLFLLRQEASQRPVYSESPPVNELLRVAEGFMLGRLPLERFRKRLDQFIELHHTMTLGLDVLQPTPAEQKVLAEQGEVLREAMERQGDGISRLESFFEHPDVQELRLGLQTIQEAADQIVAVTHQLTGAVQPPEATKSCLRCSASNPASARYCGQCNAMFPAVMDEPTPAGQLDLREESGPRSASSENLQVLTDLVEQMRVGAITDEEFLKKLDWFQGKVEGVRKRLSELEPPHPDTPPEQLEILEEAHEHMAVGADDMEAGLNTLRSFLQRRDPGKLARGLEMVNEAAGVMLRVEELFRSLTTARP